MRIKINDKIYRLKEIESGVDSLMELVEEPKYKDGDFVVNEAGSILIFKKKVENMIYDHAFLAKDLMLVTNSATPTFHGIKRLATEAEKQDLLDALAKRGQRWNEEKKFIEDIPKRKFKAGDKVKIKDGVSSKTHKGVGPAFTSRMDEFIGKELTVKKYSRIGWIVFYEDDYGYQFSEDWLEPCSDEPKVGDWVIFWDRTEVAKVGMLTDIRPDELDKYVVDHHIGWKHAVKWDGTVDHLQKIRSGKV